jgi:hypothetical protein
MKGDQICVVLVANQLWHHISYDLSGPLNPNLLHSKLRA